MYFFTEYDKLISQFSASSTPYGPVDTDHTHLYKISSEFDLSAPAKAIACQDAMMIVQPYVDAGVHNAALVNIILKPLEGLSIPFKSVKYYVYRGIDIESLMNAAGTAMKPDAPTTNSEFLNNFWVNINDQITKGIITLAPDPKDVFGYDSTAISTPANQPGNMLIETLFNAAINTNRAVKVSGGEWIGEFSNTVTIQFEIITDSDHYIEDTNNPDHLRFDLSYFRQSKHIVDVTDISPVSGTLTSQQEAFKLKLRREEVLAFIDPAAFYGMHFYSVVNERYDNAGVLDHRKRKKQAIREYLLNKFYTFDTVYIDVRSEFGYSYNFYENYFVNGTTDAWELKVEGSSGYSPDGYLAFDWPIFIANGWVGSTGRKNTVGIRMKMDGENRDPRIYIDNTQLLGRFRKKRILYWDEYPETPNPTLSDPFVLKFPNNLTDYGSITIASSIANYLGLQYFRNENYTGTATTKVLPSVANLDTVFGDIRLPERPGSGEIFKNPKAQKLQYVRGGDFDYVAYPEAFTDAASVLYFTEIEYANKRTRKKRSVNFETTDSLVMSPVFPKNLGFQKVLIRENTVSIGTPVYANRYVLEITGYQKDKKGSTNVEDLFVLGLTNTERDLLYAAADASPALTKRHPQFFVFEEVTTYGEEFGVPFKKYKLKVQGLDDTGTVQLKTPSTDVFVYSTSSNAYASDAFTTSSTIPIGLPDPALITQWDHVGYYKYQSAPGVFVSVPDNDNNNFVFSGSTQAEVNADVYFPADSKNVTSAAGISTRQTDYPMVVIVHGNGQKYESYGRISKHLAMNGFIVASIDCLQTAYFEAKVNATGTPGQYFFELMGNAFIYVQASAEYYVYDTISGTWVLLSIVPFGGTMDTATPPVYFRTSTKLTDSQGMGELGRAHLLMHHLNKLKTDFTIGGLPKIQNNIGLMGHSRGGEGIVIASRLIANGVTTPDISGVDNVNALLSLAPSDQADVEYLSQDIPYLVIYGSKDGDISRTEVFTRKNAVSGVNEEAVRRTGFSLWDRATGQEKSMLFVHGATHNGFVTFNADDPYIKQSSTDHLEIEDNQRTILDAYVNAWFRSHLKNETLWSPYYKGDLIPASSRFPKTDMNVQYKVKSTDSAVVNNYEGATDDPDIDANGATGILRKLPKPGYTYPAWVPANYEPAHQEKAYNLWNIDSKVEGFSAHGSASHLLDLSFGSSYTAGTSLALDVSNYAFFSFRIAKVFSAPIDLTPTAGTSLPVPNFSGPVVAFADLSKLKVKINGVEVAVTATIPDPYKREDFQERSKTAMKTVRIPLSEFAGINPAAINEVSFEFNTSSGLVMLDDIEFVN